VIELTADQIDRLSLAPAAVTDAAAIVEHVRTHAAAILPGIGPTEEDARAATRSIFADRILALPEAAAVYEGGEGDAKPFGPEVPLPLHTDGFAYGAQAPDHFLLSCVRDGDTGGESVMIDAYALLDVLRVADPELHDFVTTVDVDQTEPGMRPFVAPLVLALPTGRVAVRTPAFCAVAPDSADPDRDQQMIDRWFAALEAVRSQAHRFRMSPGDLICIDNYRVLHSRDAYTGPRKLWRVWVWTDLGNGVPSGILHSDARYASLPT
jgi:alpha-ketoglutarate-dependent taurine dioxygenase